MHEKMTVVCISIGPVQEFIAAARRTRDFAFGSHLLAVLARRATELVQAHAAEVVFPAETGLAAANKIVYVHRTDAAVAEVMHAVEKALRGLLTAEFDRIVERTDLPDESRRRGRAQVADLLEFYWSYATAATYRDAYQAAEHALAARKSFRDFAAFPGGSRLPKSSITGTYESLIPEEWHNSSDYAKPLYRHFRSRLGERLSGVDILKRMGALGFGERFPSLAQMAARSALIRSGHFDVATGKYTPAFDEGWRAIDAEIPFHQDGEITEGKPFHAADTQEFLFPHLLRDAVLKPDQLPLLESSHRAFVQTHGLQLDKPYYAVLQADGDRMGAIINACLTKHTDATAHSAFSTALSQFSGGVIDIVAGHHGVTIYTGGDDVLALLPYQTALDCAQALQDAFVGAIAPFLTAYGIDQQPSISVGIVVAHHLEPMTDVLARVRTAEHEAKKHRSACALIVSKRSGGETMVCGQWQSGLVDRIRQLVVAYNNNEIPRGYAYEIRALAAKLYRDNDDTDATGAILALEADRILKRKQRSDGGTVAVADLKELCAGIVANTERDRYREWVNELIVARELA